MLFLAKDRPKAGHLRASITRRLPSLMAPSEPCIWQFQPSRPLAPRRPSFLWRQISGLFLRQQPQEHFTLRVGVRLRQAFFIKGQVFPMDEIQARRARAQSFLRVPLFKAVYQKYQGTILPPTAALERDMVGLGVSEKQKDRARQVLERSAEQAGFLESGKNKLIIPAMAQGSGAPAGDQQHGSANGGGKGSDASLGAGSGGGDGGGNGGPNDPLIKALIQRLPTGSSWPTDDGIDWLKMLVMGFQVAYGTDAEIEIKKKEATN
jgi:hypothetical protein